ncbi:MAG: hypothetical protein CM15mP58_15160 [Burkholderiaceae bacterium]|nr:MAG: hypothetical protein CM15mP58_15160 [Burkholderiaceae bacterium]
MGAISQSGRKETKISRYLFSPSMFAFFMQDLIPRTFRWFSFYLTPGETTKLSGMQHAGVFVGMIFVSIICLGRFSTRKLVR